MSDNKLCMCNGVIANTGKSNNDKLFGVTAMTIAVPLIGSDGTPNSLDATGDVDAQLLAGFTAQNPLDRFYPVRDLQNVTFPDEGDQFATASNGQTSKTRLSIKSMAYEVWDVSYVYMEQLLDRCIDFGIYRVDVCGNILGSVRAANDVRPLMVNRNSLSVIPTDAVDDSKQKAMVNFQLMPYESSNFGKWGVISGTKAEQAVGMLDAVVDVTIDSATSATLTITQIYGDASGLNPILGLVGADVVINNYTTDTSGIALTTLVESTTVKGQYTATFAAQTTSDKITFEVYKAATDVDILSYAGESVQVDAQ